MYEMSNNVDFFDIDLSTLMNDAINTNSSYLTFRSIFFDKGLMNLLTSDCKRDLSVSKRSLRLNE